MSDFVQQKNIEALLTPRVASAYTSIVAAGSGDNTAVVGVAIQRSLIGLPLTAMCNILWSAVLGATKSLSLKTLLIEHSVDGSTWTTYKTFTDPGIVATSVGGGTVEGQTHVSVDLMGANDYVRFDWTPDLSNTATDTASLIAEFVFAGADRLPAVA
jgi:hypothetical protein